MSPRPLRERGPHRRSRRWKRRCSPRSGRRGTSDLSVPPDTPQSPAHSRRPGPPPSGPTGAWGGGGGPPWASLSALSPLFGPPASPPGRAPVLRPGCGPSPPGQSPPGRAAPPDRRTGRTAVPGPPPGPGSGGSGPGGPPVPAPPGGAAAGPAAGTVVLQIAHSAPRRAPPFSSRSLGLDAGVPKKFPSCSKIFLSASLARAMRDFTVPRSRSSCSPIS